MLTLHTQNTSVNFDFALNDLKDEEAAAEDIDFHKVIIATFSISCFSTHISAINSCSCCRMNLSKRLLSSLKKNFPFLRTEFLKLFSVSAPFKGM